MDGHTKIYGVLGHPITHTQSPQIQNKLFEISEYNGVYIAIHMPPERIAQDIDFLKTHFSGFNLTIPLKEKIFPYLDEIDVRAKWYGSVNTVKCDGDRLLGYSTDGIGLLKALAVNNIDVKDKNVLVLGAGGVARVVVFECANLNCNVTIAVRNADVDSANTLASNVISSIPLAKINVCTIDNICGEFDLLVQCTPVGMPPLEGEMPVSTEVILSTKAVFDAIYSPRETKLIKVAKQYGIKAVNGAHMLLFQAVKSQEIWTGYSFTNSQLDSLFDYFNNLK